MLPFPVHENPGYLEGKYIQISSLGGTLPSPVLENTGYLEGKYI